jgi:hypothetical protein
LTKNRNESKVSTKLAIRIQGLKGHVAITPCRRKAFARILLSVAGVFIVISYWTSGAKAEAYNMATRNIEPFSFIKDGQRTGYSIDLWKAIADDLQLDYSILEVGTARQMLASELYLLRLNVKSKLILHSHFLSLVCKCLFAKKSPARHQPCTL